MISHRHHPASFILIAPAGTVLALHAYLGSFTRLLADDFCSAYYAGRLGLLRSIWYWYVTWSGRYSAFGADWLMEKIGRYALPIIPPLSLLTWLILAWIAVHLSLRYVMSRGRSMVIAFTLATIFLFVVLQLSPNIPQSFYWWNGMRSYSLPLIILTLYAVLFQIGLERLKTKKEVMTGTLASFLFMIASGGLSETYVAFQTVLLAFLLTLEWFVRRDKTTPQFQFLLAGLIGSVIAMAIVVLAPGNAVRQGFYPAHPDIATLLQISLRGYLDFIFEIIRSPEKILGLLGALLAAFWFGVQSDNKPAKNYRLVPLSFLGSFILSFACFLPGAYAVSDSLPPRSIIIPIFILVAGLLHAGFTLGQSSIEQSRLPQPAVGTLLFIAILLTTYSAVINSQTLYNSRKVYIEFAQKWDETDSLILKAKADQLGSVTIPAMDNWAGLERPTPKKEYWPNVCYSLYYGIQVFGPRYSE